MKNLLLLACICFTIPALAQKKFSEGTLSYDIVINTGSEKTQAADFFDGATSTIYIKGNRSRIEIISALGTQTTIVDGTRNSIAILKEYGEQKYLIQMTPQEYQQANEKYNNVVFTYYNEEKI